MDEIKRRNICKGTKSKLNNKKACRLRQAFLLFSSRLLADTIRGIRAAFLLSLCLRYRLSGAVQLRIGLSRAYAVRHVGTASLCTGRSRSGRRCAGRSRRCGRGWPCRMGSRVCLGGRGWRTGRTGGVSFGDGRRATGLWDGNGQRTRNAVSLVQGYASKAWYMESSSLRERMRSAPGRDGSGCAIFGGLMLGELGEAGRVCEMCVVSEGEERMDVGLF